MIINYVYVLAASFASIALASSPEPDSPLAGTRMLKLANGLTVITREQRDAPLIAIDLWVRAGSGFEREDEAGAAHFLEHMLFKGTQKLRPGETDAAFEDIGSQLNAGTTREAVHFHATVAPEYLTSSLETLADMVQNAKLDNGELERERTVILDELALRKNDWRRVASDALYRAAFPGCATRGPVAGDPESVLKLTRESIERFYRRRYRPDACTLVIIGSVIPESANKAALKAFGAWSSSMLDAESQPVEAKVGANMAIHAQTPDSVAALGVRLPPKRSIETSISASILAIIVGDSRNGRIAESLRKMDRASTAAWEVPTGNTSGLLMFLARSSTQRAVDMVRTLEVELDRVLKEGVTESEVEWARRRVIGAYLFEVETYSGQARLVASNHLSYGYLSAVNYIDLVRGVSAEEVNDFLRLSLTKERRISFSTKAQ